MPSIFDPPAGARTFNASDWLAAIDVQMRTPPSPPPIDEAEQIADEPLATWDTEPVSDTQPAAAHRRLRNLPWAIVATCAAMIWTVLVVAAFDGAPVLVVAALAICLLELLIWLGLAWRFDRL